MVKRSPHSRLPQFHDPKLTLLPAISLTILVSVVVQVGLNFVMTITRPRLSLFSALRSPYSARRFSTESRLTSDHVRIVEVGARDGLQNEKKTISMQTKLELIERLAKTGVTTIEAGSFVPAKWVPQV